MRLPPFLQFFSKKVWHSGFLRYICTVFAKDKAFMTIGVMGYFYAHLQAYIQCNIRLSNPVGCS